MHLSSPFREWMSAIDSMRTPRTAVASSLFHRPQCSTVKISTKGHHFVMQEISTGELRSLLERVTKRDNAAIGVLYKHYQRFVFSFVVGLVSDQDIADEIVNDTFKVMCLKSSTFDYSSKFSTWLCGIAKNKALDSLRARGRNKETESLDEDEAQQFPDASPAILEHLENAERAQVLRKCIEELSAIQKATAVFVFYHELSMEEVAALQDCPVGTVKTRLFYAREKIMNCVRQKYEARSSI